MSVKEIIYDDEARKALEAGVIKVAAAVKTTLGPRGRNVVLGKSFGSPMVTKDGVTVAKEIELDDHFENLGAQLVKEVASKTNDVAGDGTTTATVLAEAIVKEGLKYITAGGNPIAVKRGIEMAVEKAVEEIKAIAIPISTKEEIEQIATISGNDAEIGKIISEAIDAVGMDGVVTLEESMGKETILEVVEGMQFDRGYLSPYMINNVEKMEVVLEKPYILVYDKKISTVIDIQNVLETVHATRRPLLIIADDVDGVAIQTIIINKMKGIMEVAAVKSPGFGDRRKAMMEDIACITGADYVSEELGYKLADCGLEVLGTCEKVVITKDYTTIIDGAGEKETIQDRIKMLRKQAMTVESTYDREKFQDRLAKLSGGIGVIRIGASTEAELKEKKHRFEDALSATRAAVEEGIVPGGGLALLRTISKITFTEPITPDVQVGVDIVKRSLEAPIRQIVENAGIEASVVVAEVLKASPEIGYDAALEQYVDLVKSGIVDPVKVTRSALQNASSIACLILTTNCLVDDKEKAETNMPQGMM